MKVLKKIHSITNYISNAYTHSVNMLLLKLLKVEYDNTLNINGRVFLRNKGTIKIERDVVINSKYSSNPIGGQSFTSIVVLENAVLKIGNNVGISNSAIYCAQKIIIGNKVYIGGDCKIYDTDFHSIFLCDRMIRPEKNQKISPVIIKDGAFIGTGTIILKGVTVGKESVIAAGSVIVKDIPDNEIWGGNPAKFLRKIN